MDRLTIKDAKELINWATDDTPMEFMLVSNDGTSVELSFHGWTSTDGKMAKVFFTTKEWADKFK